MIRVLKNPLTANYTALKQHILSPLLPWYWQEGSTVALSAGDEFTNVQNYTHVMLARPDEIGGDGLHFSRYDSPLVEAAARCLVEILEHNGVGVNCFMRICANCVHPAERVLSSIPHVDHRFPHSNLLVYLTGSDGSTVVEGERCEPAEDKAVLFQGEHHMMTPTAGRRVVLVATFI